MTRNFEKVLMEIDVDTLAMMIHGDASSYFNKCNKCAFGNKTTCQGNCHEGIVLWLLAENEKEKR